MTRKETLKNEIVMIGSGKSAPFYLLTENTIKEIITRTFSQEVTFVQGAGQSVNVPYTIPDGYDFLDVSKIYTNNVITSTCYQGHTTSNINLFSYAITGGNGTANVSILFKKL